MAAKAFDSSTNLNGHFQFFHLLKKDDNMILRITPILIFTVCCTPFSGCGKPLPSDLPQLEKCSLTVKLDGSPLVEATVNLYSEQPSKWFSGGITNEQGVAEMLTQAEYPGVPTGDYVVTVMKEGNDPGAPVDPENGGKTIIYVDPKFANRDTSPLKCTVKEGDNNFEFEVEAPQK